MRQSWLINFSLRYLLTADNRFIRLFRSFIHLFFWSAPSRQPDKIQSAGNRIRPSSGLALHLLLSSMCLYDIIRVKKCPSLSRFGGEEGLEDLFWYYLEFASIVCNPNFDLTIRPFRWNWKWWIFYIMYSTSISLSTGLKGVIDDVQNDLPISLNHLYFRQTGIKICFGRY